MPTLSFLINHDGYRYWIIASEEIMERRRAWAEDPGRPAGPLPSRADLVKLYVKEGRGLAVDGVFSRLSRGSGA